MIALMLAAAIAAPAPDVAGLPVDQAIQTCRTMAGNNLQAGESTQVSVDRLLSWTRERGMEPDQQRELLIFCAGWSFGFGDGVEMTAKALAE